jgi:hypothetical protein
VPGVLVAHGFQGQASDLDRVQVPAVYAWAQFRFDLQTHVVSGTDCSVSETDGCAVVECPNGEPVSVCDGEDGQDGAQGQPGSVGPPGEDGQDGSQGDAGPQGSPGRDGQDGAVIAVKNFELADIFSVDFNDGQCTFSDDQAFAGVYLPLDIEEGQRLIVFTHPLRPHARSAKPARHYTGIARKTGLLAGTSDAPTASDFAVCRA